MIKQILTSALFVAMSGETAFAAEGSANGTWGIAFWVFIGYCSLIIIPQALRACKFLLNPGGRAANNGHGTQEPRAARDTTR
ncbi:hypothetical protein [Geobacter argillaceus]|uniref:hypothetical protein n=1 Tax=Geobacter argillaceus TaxID=345631 RepID=UPI0011A97CF8|nr:hypothetical protein [Geobacter argillaceus]